MRNLRSDTFGVAAFLVYSLLLTATQRGRRAAARKHTRPSARCAMVWTAAEPLLPASPPRRATSAPDEVKKETDAEWTDITTKGKNKMPSFEKKLTEAEVKDVIAYMRSLCKK